MNKAASAGWAFSTLVIVPLLAGGTAEGQQRRQRVNDGPQPMTLSKLELGMSGYLTFPVVPGRRVTLLPLEIEDVSDGKFLGSLTSSRSGRKTSVVVRGIDTKGLVTGRYYQLNGVVKVVDTEDVYGEVVFVLEPADPEAFALKRSKSPELEMPR